MMNWNSMLNKKNKYLVYIGKAEYEILKWLDE